MNESASALLWLAADRALAQSGVVELYGRAYWKGVEAYLRTWAWWENMTLVDYAHSWLLMWAVWLAALSLRNAARGWHR